MPTLTIRSGRRAGEALGFERTVVIGRGAADLVLDDSTVSRRHAELAWTDGRCVVTDLRTGNGTFVNGRRIAEPTPLADGDELRLGRVVLSYACEATAAGGVEEVSVALVEPEGPPSIVMAVDAQARPGPQAVEVDPQRVIAGLHRRIDALNELGADLGRTFDEAVLLEKVMDRLFELLPQADRGMLLLQGDGGELLPRIARTRQGQATHIAASRTLIREVISLRKGVLSVDTQGDARFREAESLIGIGVRTLVCVPMLAYDQVYGVIQVDSSQGALPFDEADVALVFAMACQVATAIANARMHAKLVAQELLQRDLLLARSIQRHFLPRRTPELPGRCFAVEYAPALAVGGDFYDFLELPGGQVGVAVGDVSGKGVSAALYVAKLGSELRYAAVGQTEPGLILERANDALAREENEEAMFVTLVLVTLDAAGRLKVANAGHLTPLVRRSSGRVESLQAPAQSPLGVREQVTFDQTSHRLDPADVLVLYSDGVTEATSRTRELFGDERLAKAVGAAGGNAPAVCAAIVSDVRGFLDGAPQNDDITVVTVGAC